MNYHRTGLNAVGLAKRPADHGGNTVTTMQPAATMGVPRTDRFRVWPPKYSSTFDSVNHKSSDRKALVRREYQDFNFTVDCVANRTVTRLLGLILDDAPDDAPCVVFAQFEDEADWHRFFLQAQIGFWEIWNSDTINDEFQNRIDDGDRLVDYGPLIGGLPQVLSVAAAIGTENAPTHMRLSFLNGRAISLVPDGPDLDANFHIVAESASAR